VGGIMQEVANRVGTALSLPVERVFIDRRTGVVEEDAAYVDDADLNLQQGQGTLCADRYTLGLSITAILTDSDENTPVFVQRLAKLDALFAGLTWGGGNGTAIDNAGLSRIVSANVTEPGEPLSKVYTIIVRWECDTMIPRGGA
jgi:hypothetical protein